MTPLSEISVTTLAGQTQRLGDFLGKATVVVNVASKCGFTPQYEGLETLFAEFKDRGLMVLGFPCNQFGQQEPGNAAEIQAFCALTYAVSFPMFAKIDVNGPNAHPLYAALTSAAPGVLGTKRVKWNFTKFLIDHEGRVVRRYAPTTKPAMLAAEITALLDK